MDFALFRRQQARSLPERLEKVAARPDRPEAMVSALVSAVCAGDTDTQRAFASALFPGAPNVVPMEIAPLVSLGDWCNAHGAPYRVVHEPQKITVNSTSPYTNSYEYVTEPSIYACLPKARIVPGWDQVFTSDGQVIGETSYAFSDRIKVPKVISTQADLLLPEPNVALFYCGNAEVVIDEEVFFLSVPYVTLPSRSTGKSQYHYGHWLIDFLPRLLAFQIGEPSESWKIAVPDDVGAKHLESIRMLGFGEDRILRLRRDTRYLCRNLHVFKIGRSMPPNPEFVRFLRSRLFSGATKPTRGKRIFLERGDIGTRMIANAVEVDALLEKYGFTWVDVAALTMAEQQDLLADAEVLMGSFGSALLSVYFAPPGSYLIDIIGDHRSDPTMPHTCSFIGVKHQFLTCKPAAPDPAKSWHTKDPDLLVDCAELERRLKEIEAEPR